jgi:hypothetical protein
MTGARIIRTLLNGLVAHDNGLVAHDKTQLSTGDHDGRSLGDVRDEAIGPECHGDDRRIRELTGMPRARVGWPEGIARLAVVQNPRLTGKTIRLAAQSG